MNDDNMKTLYIYDKSSGSISYTINNPTPMQISNLNDKGVCTYLGSCGQTSINTYVTLDADTQEPNGIASIQELNNNLIYSDNAIVGNGTHSISVSGFPPQSAVIFSNEPEISSIAFISSSTNDSMEISPSFLEGFSDKITFSVIKYGHHSKTFSIPIIQNVVSDTANT
jgi:hypothetical protein